MSQVGKGNSAPSSVFTFPSHHSCCNFCEEAVSSSGYFSGVSGPEGLWSISRTWDWDRGEWLGVVGERSSPVQAKVAVPRDIEVTP